MLLELEPLAQELEENRRLMDQILGHLRAEEMDRSPREGEYSPRQVLAHLAGAERGMTRLIQLMAAGEKPQLKPDYNNDYYNARQQEKRAKMGAAALRAELEETRRALLAVMESLKAEDLGKLGEHPTIGEASVLEVLKTLQTHERDHIVEMSVWADKLVRTRLDP
jgi:uncharacterized damage-inducible protein DinB